MIVLFLCPIGVRNAHDAATATAIRNGSGLTPSWCAMSTPIGAAMSAVATLLSTSERLIVTIINAARTATTGNPAVQLTIVLAMSAVPPLDSNAVPIGINDPSKMMTGHSTDSYNCVSGTIFSRLRTLERLHGTIVGDIPAFHVQLGHAVEGIAAQRYRGALGDHRQVLQSICQRAQAQA